MEEPDFECQDSKSELRMDTYLEIYVLLAEIMTDCLEEET